MRLARRAPGDWVPIELRRFPMHPRRLVALAAALLLACAALAAARCSDEQPAASAPWPETGPAATDVPGDTSPPSRAVATPSPPRATPPVQFVPAELPHFAGQ